MGLEAVETFDLVLVCGLFLSFGLGFKRTVCFEKRVWR
jgi:hypothetical protein